MPSAFAIDRGTFQRESQRVAIHLLQQRASHAVAPDILRPASAGELRGDVLDGVEIDAIALDEAHAGDGGFPAFAVDFVAENFADNFEKLLEDSDGVAGVRANDKRAVALQDLFAEGPAPKIAHGVVDIVGIADTGDETFGAIFEDVGVSLELVSFAPRGDGGMFRSGDAVAGAVGGIAGGKIGGIKLVEKLNRRERVCAEKIEKMRGAANGRGFFGRDSAETEIVQLEGE